MYEICWKSIEKYVMIGATSIFVVGAPIVTKSFMVPLIKMNLI